MQAAWKEGGGALRAPGVGSLHLLAVYFDVLRIWGHAGSRVTLIEGESASHLSASLNKLVLSWCDDNLMCESPIYSTF